MADEGDNNIEEGTTVVMVWAGSEMVENIVPIIRYTYRGEEGEIIPREATHITVGEGVTFVRERAFFRHPNIVELICHDKVEKIEMKAFGKCFSLRRVIMPGIKIVEKIAFVKCKALTDVECGKLEIINEIAFCLCESMRSIDLPSARIVKGGAFDSCMALEDIKFGSKLERIEEMAFWGCTSLERITIPLKDGLITDDDIFTGCESLKHVDLIEGELHETIAALHLEEWRDDMSDEIDSINRNLPGASAGYYYDWWYTDEEDEEGVGEKARVIRTWIRSILSKIIHYQEEHRRLLDDVATTLQLALPHDIVMNSVLPFLGLPSHTFGVDDEDEAEHDASYF